MFGMKLAERLLLELTHTSLAVRPVLLEVIPRVEKPQTAEALSAGSPPLVSVRVLWAQTSLVILAMKLSDRLLLELAQTSLDTVSQENEVILRVECAHTALAV